MVAKLTQLKMATHPLEWPFICLTIYRWKLGNNVEKGKENLIQIQNSEPITGFVINLHGLEWDILYFKASISMSLK